MRLAGQREGGKKIVQLSNHRGGVYDYVPDMNILSLTTAMKPQSRLEIGFKQNHESVILAYTIAWAHHFLLPDPFSKQVSSFAEQ